METIITWSIDWMQTSTQEVNGFSEVVLSAGWRCTGTNGNISTGSYGSVAFPEPAVNGTYIPYADLTLDTVLGWVWANGVEQAPAEEAVTSQVEALANPPVVSLPLPWTSSNNNVVS